MISKMAKMKQNREDAVERELRQALLEMPQRDGPREICPTLDVLKRFVAFTLEKEAARTQVLAHLDVCTRCLQTVVQLRNRHIRIRRSALALVAFVLIAAVLWIWPTKPLIQSVIVAIVDLSDAAPTRGNHRIDISPVRVGADTHRLRIILPLVSAEGIYEIAVFPGEAGNTPILQTTSSTTMQEHHLELSVALNFSRIARGNYSLAIRHDDSNWEYVPLVRE